MCDVCLYSKSYKEEIVCRQQTDWIKLTNEQKQTKSFLLLNLLARKEKFEPLRIIRWMREVIMFHACCFEYRAPNSILPFEIRRHTKNHKKVLKVWRKSLFSLSSSHSPSKHFFIYYKDALFWEFVELFSGSLSQLPHLLVFSYIATFFWLIKIRNSIESEKKETFFHVKLKMRFGRLEIALLKQRKFSIFILAFKY
jgi:hypothetical protein